MKTIIVCRCAQSVNKEVTGYGFWQAHSVGKMLQQRNYNIQRLVYCDAPTRQTANVIAATINWYLRSEVRPEEMLCFLPKYKDGVLEELQTLSRHGATMNEVLRESEKACLVRAQVNKALLCLAKDMQSMRQETALVVTHSLFAELAVPPHAPSVPLGLGEGDCVVYGVDVSTLRIADWMHAYIPASIPSHSKF